ncbi:M4 family metallopeptidase [Streptomyces sp. NPDC006691]|uniref:M4 family metallopeptidase n=1 Tax=Streptomyces sp. NPDC006691 TaxID=3364757 RepID=UPI00369C2F4B
MPRSRTRSTRARAHTNGRSRRASAAVLISAAALVVSVAPATAAQGASPPGPAEVVPGQHTATPGMVQGIREEAPGAGSAAEAARAYLAGKQSRYGIAAPARDLDPVGTMVGGGGQETVRFQQKHQGVPVLGGQYLVRMEKKDGGRVVTGTSGQYFTGLRTGTTAAISDDLAAERAVDAVLTDLRANKFTPRPGSEESEPQLTGTARGLVVLPAGGGVLARHITVRGKDPASAEPVAREVYIDAQAGYPVLQYSGIQTFGAPVTPAGTGPAARAASIPAPAPAVRLASSPASGVAGTGVRLDGKPVELQVDRDETRNAYVLRDRSRLQGDNVLATWDARGKWASDLVGTWPEDILEVASPTPAFGTEATDSGAVDAHWAAGQVHDYFKNNFGRDSLDGHGMTVNSLVGVTDYGQPYVNAFWDGQKMVYGTGDAEYRPLSAGLDVVGHEMTHGVIEHSAGLVYAGQSGAMNEAIADYFGNAIENNVNGTPTDSPDSGLLGERLCRTKAPRDCALRDMGDGRTTAKSFLGVGFGTDNGGVHLNSTIFSGALWNIRQDLGATVADRVVYKALTEYLTPIDGFTQGRAAVLAAAKDLKVPASGLKAVQRAFNGHGIAPGWELALGVDSDRLLDRVNTSNSRVGAGGGWWTASQSNEAGSEPYSVWAGRADGKGRLKLMSPNDGRYHVNPATDGKTVVWQAYGAKGVDILARPLTGGPVRTLWHTSRSVGASTSVDGDTVAFPYYNYGGRPGIAYLSLKDPANVVQLGGGTYHRTYFPSVSHGKVVYQDMQRVAGRPVTYQYTTRVVDVSAGTDTVVQEAAANASLGPTAVNGTHVYWLTDEKDGDGSTALRRSGFDGSGVVDLSPEGGPDALNAYDLTVSEDAVTVGTRTYDPEFRNESLAKLWQFSATASPSDDGARKGRVSCNRGDQLSAAAAAGGQVVWIDATTGVSQVVTRTRPTGRCA